VLKRTIMPALSRLNFQTASVTLPSATAGRRSNQRLRSMSSNARPSKFHWVTSFQVRAGSLAGAVAAGGCGVVAVAAGDWAKQALEERKVARTSRRRVGERIRGIIFNLSALRDRPQGCERLATRF